MIDDFFDDFDWEDMAMIGGMAEEFGEEKRYRRRRGGGSESDRRQWDREEYLDPEDEFDFNNGFSRRPVKPQYEMRRPRRKPFEQYADDVAHGRKSHHDPLFGPAKVRRGERRHPKDYTDTILYGVHVKNAHLISENFLKFVCTIFYGHPDQEIERIVFDPDGNPVVDGHEVFSTYDRGTRTITMNLRRHFTNAARIAAHGYTKFSMQALIWTGMVGTVLHELKHALDACEPGHMDYVPREEQERIADQWAAEAKTYYASNGHAEMPAIADEPYFGPLIKKYIDQAIAEGDWEWAKRQKALLADGAFFRSQEDGIAIGNMEEFINLSLKGQEEEGPGRRLNDLIKIQNEYENSAWDKDEMSEQALQEAISNGYRTRIEYSEAEGKSTAVTITPRRLFKRNMFIWVEGYDESEEEPFVFRVDLINNIHFHT